MDSNQTIRIGIIGAGGIVQSRHLPGLQKISGVELVAVCNRSPESSRAVAEKWGIKRVARSPDDIIKAKDIHAVLIGTWPNMHHILSCSALKAGKHVFTQARMARDLKEAKMMRDEARRHPKLVAMICPSPYFMKTTLFIQKLLHENFVGQIRLVRFQHLTSAVADSQAAISWRQQKQLNGLNTLSYGIFMERFLQWFGPVKSVQAVGSIFTSRRKDAKGKSVPVSVPDQLLVMAQLKNHPGQLQLSFSGAVQHASPERVEIYGEEGTLVVTPHEVLGSKAGEKELRSLPLPLELLQDWNVEADFIDAIRAGGRKKLPPERTRFFSPDFDEGVRYMAVTEATLKAVKTGKTVSI